MILDSFTELLLEKRGMGQQTKTSVIRRGFMDLLTVFGDISKKTFAESASPSNLWPRNLDQLVETELKELPVTTVHKSDKNSTRK